MVAPGPSQAGCQHHVSDLEALFRDCFFADYLTVLVGGHSEPLYLPATSAATGMTTGAATESQLQYREDFYSSALHEVAHWCIAGRQRRELVDFGYWYYPDGRSAIQQRAFEKVEVRPQALEWVFSVAAGIPFRISNDNLFLDEAADPNDFAAAVYRQVQYYCAKGLPPRSARFADALAAFYSIASPLDPSQYSSLEQL